MAHARETCNFNEKYFFACCARNKCKTTEIVPKICTSLDLSMQVTQVSMFSMGEAIAFFQFISKSSTQRVWKRGASARNRSTIIIMSTIIRNSIITIIIVNSMIINIITNMLIFVTIINNIITIIIVIVGVMMMLMTMMMTMMMIMRLMVIMMMMMLMMMMMMIADSC